MAEQARLIFKTNTEKKIGSLVIDAFISETHSRSNAISVYPVENGSDISDHIQEQPKSLSVTGMISPVKDGSNIVSSFLELDKIMKSKEVLTVVSGLKVYTNMIITSLVIPRTAQNGASLNFSATMNEIRVVSSQAVTIPNSQISDADEVTNKQAQAKQNAGKVTNGQTQKIAEGSNFLDQIDAQIDEIFGVVKK